MTIRRPLCFLFLALLPTAARGQLYHGSENYFLAGASFASTETIGGSNVTVSGSPGFSELIGFAFEVKRKSAVTLWVEPFPLVLDSPGGSSSTKGSGSAGGIMVTPSARLMVPLEPRFSVFGAVGGGAGQFQNYTLSSDIPPQLTTHSAYHGVFSAGGGIDFRISRHFSIRVDARDYVTGRGLGGVLGRNHFLPMMGVVLHL